ncbi:MAG: hypothetical protein ACJ75T_01705 [Solirubrobacterales bacterium]
MRAFAQAPSAESPTPGSGSTFSFGALAAMLVCAAAFLGIGAPAASAAPEAQPGWSHQGTFGKARGSAFEGSQSPLAIDGDGNVFATDQSAGSVNGYAPDGSSLGSYGFTAEVQNLAADFGENVLYVDNLFGGPVTRWISDGAPTPTYSADPGFTAVAGGAGIAVDPSTNDLLVADPGAEAVRRYDTTGTLLDTIATASINPTWIAAATDGSFYVAPEGGSDITHLSATGAVLGTIAGVGALEGLAFDPSHELLVASAGGMLKNYAPAGQLVSEFDGSGAAWIAAGENGLLYGLANGAINKYVLATVPGVEAPLVTNIQSTSVHVSAEVDPGAGPPEGSRAHFEYSSDGGDSWKETLDEAVERTPTEEPDMIEADLTGLALNTHYLVRVKALNSLTSSISPTTSFSTPEIAPLVETGVASDLSETSAILHGTVNPAGLQTGYHFDYGTTTAYGNRIPVSAEGTAGNNRVLLNVSRLITGLQPGVTYHYRLVAENAIGETAGDDRTFTALTLSELFPQRAYEQVTPVDKEGAQVLSDFHVQAANDGSAIAVTTVQAPAAAPSSLILQNHLSRRGADGWLDWQPTDAPQDAVPGLNEASTVGMSEDFEHALVISNRALAPGGIAGGGNLYVKDMATGDYTFVAGAPGAGSWKALVGIQANEKIFLAAAPDFSWILFWGQPQFLPDASGVAIYRWTRATGDLKIESLLPGEIVPPFEVQFPDAYKRELPSASDDGSVIGYGLPTGVYRRVDGETKAVSVSEIPGDSTEAQSGNFDGMTPDGRYIFFRSGARLTEDAPESVGGLLYRYDAVTDDLEYLTQAGGYIYGFGEDGQTIYADNGMTPGVTVVWHAGQVRTVTTDQPVLMLEGARTSVSSNGRYFVWIKESGGKAVYLYDAVADEASCLSCSPGGGPGGNARTIGIGRGIGNREPQVILDNGTVFFDTTNRLLAADHNGARDVYAYQNGRLELISPGTEDYDAFFVDASMDGSNVFFQTDQGLVGQDTDGESDVYDARVGGGFASQNPPPPPGSCTGAECAQAGGKPAASPPVSTAGAAEPATPQKKKHKNKKHKHKKHKKNHSKTAASKGR